MGGLWRVGSGGTPGGWALEGPQVGGLWRVGSGGWALEGPQVGGLWGPCVPVCGDGRVRLDRETNYTSGRLENRYTSGFTRLQLQMFLIVAFLKTIFVQ